MSSDHFEDRILKVLKQNEENVLIYNMFHSKAKASGLTEQQLINAERVMIHLLILRTPEALRLLNEEIHGGTSA